MTRRRLIFGALVVLVALAVAAGCWAYPRYRRVDGRTGGDWLALAQRATRGTMYAAEGESIVGAMRVRFTLEQHRDGRYVMRQLGDDTPGALSYDGRGTCFEEQGRCTRAETPDAAKTTSRACVRLTGTGQVAGRSAVFLCADLNGVCRELAVDRETGVMLATTTRQGRREASRMTLTQIAYRDVAPPPSAAPDVPPALRPADGAQAAKALGGHVLTPAWVPKGYSLRGAFVRDCTRCADMQTVVLRYGDGTGAVSIFEGRADAPCRRGAGDASCCATSSGALTTTRTVEGIKATAVASGLDARTLERVANSLRTADAP